MAEEKIGLLNCIYDSTCHTYIDKGTGLYRTSLKGRRNLANSELLRAQKSMLSLKKKDTPYFRENMALIGLLERVAELYNSAPDDI